MDQSGTNEVQIFVNGFSNTFDWPAGS
jgi:esterase/lipase superfamily enzyme